MSNFKTIERPMRMLIKLIDPALRCLLAPINVVILLGRKWTKVCDDLIVIKVRNCDKSLIDKVCEACNLKENKVVFLCKEVPKKQKIKPNLFFQQKDTVSSRIILSKAKVVIFTDQILRLPKKKQHQLFAYIGREKFAGSIDRKLDIKIPSNKNEILVADLKNILSLKKLTPLQRFSRLINQKYSKMEAFYRANIPLKDVFLNGLLLDWLLYYVADIFDFGCRRLLRKFFSCNSWLFPIDKKLIVVYNNFNQYSCNIKYIVEKLSNDPRWKIVYLIRDPDPKLSEISNLKQIDPRSIRAIISLSRAKVWIFNSIKSPYEPVKKKGQIFIQTWHGSLGLKRVEPEFIYDKAWLEKAKGNTEITDICVSNSDFETQLYKSCYWGKSKIWEIGHPRNDILFRDTTAIREEICRKYSIQTDSIIFLYAPTYREDYDSSMYLTNFDEIKSALEKRFGKQVTVVVRYHHWFLRKAPKEVFKTLKNSGVIDISDHPDMQEVLAAVDVGCTDYSSWIYDFILMRKPGFIYASDVEKYLQFRGFYFPLTETPFLIAKNTAEFVDNIKNFSEEEYLSKVELFLKARGCFENGDAAERFVQKLKELVVNV